MRDVCKLTRIPVWSTTMFVGALTILAGAQPFLRAENGKKDSKSKRAAAPAPQLTWPLPPEQPRIRYLTTYQGVDDFKKTKRPSKFAAMLLGSADATNQPSDAMMKPYGVAASPDGRIYVADTAARRVFAFDTDAKTVSFVGESGNSGRLVKPIGVAVDAQGTVFVADVTLKRVFGYAPDGRLAMAIGHEGELANPSGLAVDRVNKRLYVADAARHHILSYSTVDGTPGPTIGKRGSEHGEFNFPTNLAVDARGRLYVTDTLNFRIQIFDERGGFVGTFGTLGDSPGCLNRPKGVGVDSQGHIYVIDASFNNFQIFDERGQLLLFVGAGGRNPGEFFLPAGLYIDEQDRIYVADQGNSRVQVFQYINAGGAVTAGVQEGAGK
jgi:DNA-binding beta-propeller fold protein YncE